jgi:hypothetical protein
MPSRNSEYNRRFGLAADTAKWAITMTKVRIRQAAAKKPYPRWHLIDFYGRDGRESRGVVDIVAIRKDHSERSNTSDLRRGDALQIILIQVKGGGAANPTDDDAKRLRIVARQHNACGVLLASWKRGKAAQFYTLAANCWEEVPNLATIFC